jgi:hypothetical protein
LQQFEVQLQVQDQQQQQQLLQVLAQQELAAAHARASLGGSKNA